MSPKFDARPKSVTEGMLVESFLSEVPPPLPPLPLNYTALTTHMLGITRQISIIIFSF